MFSPPRVWTLVDYYSINHLSFSDDCLCLVNSTSGCRVTHLWPGGPPLWDTGLPPTSVSSGSPAGCSPAAVGSPEWSRLWTESLRRKTGPVSNQSEPRSISNMSYVCELIRIISAAELSRDEWRWMQTASVRLLTSAELTGPVRSVPLGGF